MNLQLIEMTEPVVKVTTITLIVIGVLLDLLVWRRRNYANWLFNYELLNMLNQGLVPFHYGHFTLAIHTTFLVTIYVLVGCNIRQNIIASTLTLTFVVYVEIPQLQNETWDGTMIGGKFLSILISFFLMTAASMIFTYVA